MLVLSRRKGQRILIGDVVLVVLSVHRSSVKLGFEAPKGTVVLRAEAVEATEKPVSPSCDGPSRASRRS